MDYTLLNEEKRGGDMISKSLEFHKVPLNRGNKISSLIWPYYVPVSILMYTCDTDIQILVMSLIYEPKIIFYFIFTLVQVSASKWPIHDCIGSEIGLCTKDCFMVKSPTLLHVELCAYFTSFLYNFWETFPYTVHTFWAKNHILFHIFTLATWCTSFSVQRTCPWL